MKRFYFALTNNCNRSCKYCSCFSRPDKGTFLTFEIIKDYIDSTDSEFQIQLEGGEPLLHPDFHQIIEYAVNTGRCDKVILTSNFAIVDDVDTFFHYLNFDGLKSFLVKPSINYDLYKEDPNFFIKMKDIKDTLVEYPKFELKFNVRLDKTRDDNIVLYGLREYNLMEDSNIFHYQRYGYASNNLDFDLPFVITDHVDFNLISPDGKDFGMDLIARSEHMKTLP